MESIPPPLVSVIVPNYNHARFLPQRIDSILAQNFQNFELILLDDCSTDESRDVLHTYARRLPLKLILNERNSGSPFIQWRRGAEAAVGKYLWIAESDDFADPNLLQELVSVMEANERIGLAYCQSLRVDADGKTGDLAETGNIPLDPTRWTKNYQNDGLKELAHYLIVQNTVPNASAVLTRKDVLVRALDGAETRRLSGDWWVWGRMLLESDVAFVAKPLNFFRMHGKSVRETTAARLATTERLSLQAYFANEVSPSLKVRGRSFHASYGSWRHHVRGPRFDWDWKWLGETFRNAQRLYPLAAPRMVACLLMRLVTPRPQPTSA